MAKYQLAHTMQLELQYSLPYLFYVNISYITAILPYVVD